MSTVYMKMNIDNDTKQLQHYYRHIYRIDHRSHMKMANEKKRKATTSITYLLSHRVSPVTSLSSEKNYLKNEIFQKWILSSTTHRDVGFDSNSMRRSSCASEQSSIKYNLSENSFLNAIGLQFKSPNRSASFDRKSLASPKGTAPTVLLVCLNIRSK